MLKVFGRAFAAFVRMVCRIAICSGRVLLNGPEEWCGVMKKEGKFRTDYNILYCHGLVVVLFSRDE